MTAVITGCALIGPDGCAWGDLHQIGDCFVFVGLMRNGEMAWDHTRLEHDMAVDCSLCAGHLYFERRGVAVFPVDQVSLTAPAHACLRRSRQLRGEGS